MSKVIKLGHLPPVEILFRTSVDVEIDFIQPTKPGKTAIRVAFKGNPQEDAIDADFPLSALAEQLAIVAVDTVASYTYTKKEFLAATSILTRAGLVLVEIISGHKFVYWPFD